jgi:ferredoxin--NADP+ reductase
MCTVTETKVYPIVDAQTVAPQVKRFVVEAPRIARKHKAGQFVIVRVSRDGERIPLTISESDPDAGTIAIVVQGVGATTKHLNELDVGDALADVAGPLGRPSEIDRYGTVVTIGGGVGTAIAYPTSVAMKKAGNEVIAIIGGRTSDHVILEDELRAVCDDVIVTTDDGSAGFHGFVTQALQTLIDRGHPIDLVVAIGPIPMMRAVADVTRPHGISTVASLNPIMVDGTGMCGGCRVSVGGETKFACVDGPEFDAHQVDFELLALRNRSYLEFERQQDVGACATTEASP